MIVNRDSSSEAYQACNQPFDDNKTSLSPDHGYQIPVDEDGDADEVMSSNLQQISIIDLSSQSDRTALKIVKAKLIPKGWKALFVDKVWNRKIAVWFGFRDNYQSRLNKAKDLVLQPPKNITEALDKFAKLNATLREYDGVPITLENVLQYAQLLTEGKMLRRDQKGAVEEQFVQFSLLIKIGFKDLRQKVNSSRCNGKHSQSALMTAAQALVDWKDAKNTIGKFYTDTEFRMLLAFAHTKTIGETDDQRFVDKLTLSTWTDVREMGQAKFIRGVANDFVKAVKGIADDKCKGNEALEMLTKKIEDRADKICHITLDGGNKNNIVTELLKELNNVSGFKESFNQAQTSLITIVQNNQNLSFLAKKKLKEIQKNQQKILDAEVPVYGADGSLQGEEAIIKVLAPLRSPQAAQAALTALHGNSDDILLKGGKLVGGKYPTFAKRMISVLCLIQTDLNELVEGNTSQVVEAEKKATHALHKLSLLNQFVSKNKQQPLLRKLEPLISSSEGVRHVDINALNDPITEAQQNQIVADPIVRKALLTMMEKFVGKEDSKASPTLLNQMFLCFRPNTLAQLDSRLNLVQQNRLFAPVLVDGHSIKGMVTLPTSERASFVSMVKFADAPSSSKYDTNPDKKTVQLRRLLDRIRWEGEENNLDQQGEETEQKTPEQPQHTTNWLWKRLFPSVS